MAQEPPTVSHCQPLCLASPVCPGYQGLTLHLSCVQEARKSVADRAHLMPVSNSAAAPPDPSAAPRPLPPLLERAPRLSDLTKQGPPVSVRHTPLFKSASASHYTISAAGCSRQTHSLHRSVSDKQWSGTGAHEVFRAYHAAGLGSSSGMTAATSLAVFDKSVGPLQPGGGHGGVMFTRDQVQKTEQVSGVSAMLDKAVASREPSFSQALGSAPPGSAFSPSSGMKTEAVSGSFTAADGLLDEAQQVQQKAAIGPPSPSFLSQQDSGTAELYDSMLGPMYEQHGGDSRREGLAARLLRTASSASSSTFSSSSAGQRSPAGIKAQYMSAAKASMQKLSTDMQTRAGAAAEAFADGTFADKFVQKQQAFLQRASTSDAAAVADRLAAKGQDVLRRAAASDAAAAASARAANAATKAAEGAASVSAVAQQWTAKGLQWGKTVSWFD